MRGSRRSGRVVAAVVALAMVLAFDTARLPQAAGVIGCTAGGPVDIVADALEITQGVQDGRNRVPLVDGKRTYVRLYGHVARLKKQPPVTCVSEASLSVRLGGEVVTLAPLDADGMDEIGPERVDRFRRSDASYGFLFELPSTFRHDEIELTAAINQFGTIPETNLANNLITAEAEFREIPPIDLTIERLTYETGGTTYRTDLAEAARLVRWMRRAYPVSEIRWRSRSFDWGAANVNASGNLSDPDCNDLNFELILTHAGLDLFELIHLAGRNERFYGMVSDAGGFLRGCALGIPSAFASGPTGPSAYTWDTDGSYGDWYGGHELGHTYGRKHAEFCGAQGGGSYPYPGGAISPQTSDPDAVVGFDVATRDVYPFDEWFDVMTYCDNQWLSDFTYKRLMNRFDNPPIALPADAGPPVDQLFVVGSLGGRDGSVAEPELEPAFRVPSVAPDAGRQRGRHSIVLKDEDGRVLKRYRFKPVRAQSGRPKPGTDEPELGQRAIAQAVPFVEGTAQLEVVGPGKKVLAALRPGSASPTVDLIPPAPANAVSPDADADLHVEWFALDPDGDELTHIVQFSTDGGSTWKGAGLPTTGNSIDVARETLRGADDVRMRILTSDGINTTIDILDDPIRIPNVFPIVEILSPADGEQVRSKTTLGLEAFAYDFDDGALSGSVVWRSDRDGVLGSGDQVSVTGLSPGPHVITVEATDSSGITSKASVPIVVE